MLTMGLGGGFVTSWVGDPGAVTEYNVRFTAVVPVPNDGKVPRSSSTAGSSLSTRSPSPSLSPSRQTTGGKKIFGRAVATAKLAVEAAREKLV